ncbi:aldo/keto reductase [Thalassomonas actiniarum]|uniref:Aldo/keto reductase n=1 Tax=Thalassomonas actiniarum TaxID=485447 RepID=A0AAF0BZN1_9GAMM|nr:aldo/keto reductase [Thalassomonas actiniarum]WDD98016.1 aldo/keto reductase [Thalassomonas actiniarum]
MRNIQLGKSGLNSSRFIYGCMRITGDNSSADRAKGKLALRTAIEAGYNHFDHADIYAGGLSESLFAEVLKESPGLREQLIITSKAGIRIEDTPNPGDPKCYDFSRDYLVNSVDGILKRLEIETLDMFLLHRPDYLFNAAEVADTLMQLHSAGKVKHFGVSNFTPSQVSLLQSALPLPLMVNQVEINIHNINSFTDGTLDQCQQLGITPVAWCPLGGVAYSAWGNTFSAADEQRIENELTLQVEKYQCQSWQVILAWLLKHPAQIFPIIGSTTPERILAAKHSLELDYSREDWYRLLEARNGEPVP